MSYVQTSVIRQRNQFTIPRKISKRKKWANSGMAVDIIDEKEDEIVIRPHSKLQKTNWNEIWKGINKARAIKGGGGGNLSAFIAKDRLNH